MKIVTVLGARPQFIKAAAVSRALRNHPGIGEVLVHTGQHFDDSMSRIFFREMEIPEPTYHRAWTLLEVASGDPDLGLHLAEGYGLRELCVWVRERKPSAGFWRFVVAAGIATALGWPGSFISGYSFERFSRTGGSGLRTISRLNDFDLY